MNSQPRHPRPILLQLFPNQSKGMARPIEMHSALPTAYHSLHFPIRRCDQFVQTIDSQAINVPAAIGSNGATGRTRSVTGIPDVVRQFGLRIADHRHGVASQE